MDQKNEIPISPEVKKTIETLESKEIKYNPFGELPKEQIKKALEYLEEYSDEFI